MNATRVLDEHRLPHEEVAEVHERIDVRVRALLEGQLDVAADRAAAAEPRALVRRLHDARAAPVMIAKPASASRRAASCAALVLRVVGARARRAEDRHALLAPTRGCRTPR